MIAINENGKHKMYDQVHRFKHAQFKVCGI